jgi:hypothetical protein
MKGIAALGLLFAGLFQAQFLPPCCVVERVSNARFANTTGHSRSCLLDSRGSLNSDGSNICAIKGGARP